MTQGTVGPLSRDHEAEARAARRALSCVGHELASPLMALYTHLERAIAGGETAAVQLRACAARMRSIAELVREVAQTPGAAQTVDLVVAIESAATRVPGVAIAIVADGPAMVRMPARAAGYVVIAAVRAVARAAPDGAGLRATVEIDAGADAVRLRIDPGAAPAGWEVVDPWVSERTGLDLWTAAVVAGEDGGQVRVGEIDGAIAVELELPSAGPP